MDTTAQDSGHNIRILPAKEKDEFVGFWEWLSPTTGMKSRFVGWLALLSVILPIVASIFAIAYYITGISKNLTLSLRPFGSLTIDDTIRFSYLVQIVVIFVLLVRGSFVDVARDDRFPDYGNEGQERVRFWWSVALFSFLLLYICLWVRVPITVKLAESGIAPAEKQYNEMLSAVLGVLSNLCNNGSTLAFLMCFSAMESPVKRNVRKMDAWVLRWFGCLVMLTFIEAAVRIGHAPVASQTDWFDLLTGANAGIALAMFCGRLASPLINPPLSVMVPLYFYAVVQISFGFWDKQKTVALVMASFCLILKVLLALVITWLLTTRHLIFYMERMHQTKSQLDEWRKEFREPARVKPKEPGVVAH